MNAAATVGSAPFRQPLILLSVEAPTAARRRLAELGLRPGAALQVLRRTAGDGRIVAVAGSSVALDARTAAGLGVRPASATATAAGEATR